MFLGRRFQAHTHAFGLLVWGWGGRAGALSIRELAWHKCYSDSRDALEKRHLSKGRSRFLFGGQHFRVKIALTLGLF